MSCSSSRMLPILCNYSVNMCPAAMPSTGFMPPSSSAKMAHFPTVLGLTRDFLPCWTVHMAVTRLVLVVPLIMLVWGCPRMSYRLSGVGLLRHGRFTFEITLPSVLNISLRCSGYGFLKHQHLLYIFCSSLSSSTPPPSPTHIIYSSL